MAPEKPRPEKAELVDWIALHLLPGLGLPAKLRAFKSLGNPGEIAYRIPVRELRRFGRLTEANQAEVAEARRTLRRDAELELRGVGELGLQVVTFDDPGYPAEFEQLPDPPILLYARGHLAGARLRVAVVGSRRPTAYGKRVAAGLACSLADQGVVVVSGGARGIDSCAHRGALEARGPTVAVLGSGFRQPYPAENASLFDRIVERGAVVSEFPIDAPPLAGNFPRRNRLISGLSAAVVVVEATLRSGSLITAGHALDQGREVLAVPGPVSSELSQGCHRLIQQGAKLIQNTEDILEELSPMYRAALPAGKDNEPPGVKKNDNDKNVALEGLTPDEAAALSLLDAAEPLHIDLLAERAPFGIARLQAALFGLVVRGAVEELIGRYYLSRPWRDPR